MAKGYEYKVNEGFQIGYLPTEFGANQSIVEKKIVAGAEITKGQVVEITGDLTVAPTNAASAKVIGVAMISAEAGEPVAIETQGLFKLVAGGAITAGAKVSSGTAGKVIASTDGANAVGIALNTVATGEHVYVKFSL